LVTVGTAFESKGLAGAGVDRISAVIVAFVAYVSAEGCSRVEGLSMLGLNTVVPWRCGCSVGVVIDTGRWGDRSPVSMCSTLALILLRLLRPSLARGSLVLSLEMVLGVLGVLGGSVDAARGAPGLWALESISNARAALEYAAAASTVAAPKVAGSNVGSVVFDTV